MTTAVSEAPVDAPRTTHRAWLPELDGLRALAALSVVLVHFNPAPLEPSAGTTMLLGGWLADFSLANLGVTFFYALSAFLLTWISVRESRQPGGFRLGRFWLRRCLRIWPLYFAVLSTVLLRMWIFDSVSPETQAWTRDHVWLFGTFLSNWSLALHHIGGYVDRSIPEFAVMWSIAVEEQFYLIYPLVLAVALRSTKARIIAAGAVIAVAVGSRAVYLLTPVTGNLTPGAGGMYFATSTYLEVFLAGAIAGWIVAEAECGGSRIPELLKRRGAGVLLMATVLALGFAWEGRMWYPYGGDVLFSYPVIGLVMATGLLWTWANPEARFCRVLRSNPLRILGTLSYGIYLWHPVVGSWMATRYGPLATLSGEHDLLTVSRWITYIAATISLAAVTYGLIERPFLRLKGRVAWAGSGSRVSHGDSPSWVRPAFIAGAIAVVVDISVASR